MSHLEKTGTIGKKVHTWKNGSRLGKSVTIGINGSHSHSEIWVTIEKERVHTSKKFVTLGKWIILRKMGTLENNSYTWNIEGNPRGSH